jgi:hypothetical protein
MSANARGRWAEVAAALAAARDVILCGGSWRLPERLWGDASDFTDLPGIGVVVLSDGNCGRMFQSSFSISVESGPKDLMSILASLVDSFMVAHFNRDHFAVAMIPPLTSDIAVRAAADRLARLLVDRVLQAVTLPVVPALLPKLLGRTEIRKSKNGGSADWPVLPGSTVPMDVSGSEPIDVGSVCDSLCKIRPSPDSVMTHLFVANAPATSTSWVPSDLRLFAGALCSAAYLDVSVSDAPIRRVGYDGMNGIIGGLLIPIVPCPFWQLNLCWLGELMMKVTLVDFNGSHSAFWVQVLTDSEAGAVALSKVLAVARPLCVIPEILARIAGALNIWLAKLGIEAFVVAVPFVHTLRTTTGRFQRADEVLLMIYVLFDVTVAARGGLGLRPDVSRTRTIAVSPFHLDLCYNVDAVRGAFPSEKVLYQSVWNVEFSCLSPQSAMLLLPKVCVPLVAQSLRVVDYHLSMIPEGGGKLGVFGIVLYVIPPKDRPFDSPQLDLSSLMSLAVGGGFVRARWFQCPRALEAPLRFWRQICISGKGLNGDGARSVRASPRGRGTTFAGAVRNGHLASRRGSESHSRMSIDATVPVSTAEAQSLAELVRSVVRIELAQSVMPVVDAQVTSLTLTRDNVEKIVSGIDDRIDTRLKASRDAIFDLIAAQNAHLSMFTAAMTKQMEGLNLSIGRVTGDGAPLVVMDAAADVIMQNVV